MPVFIDTQDGRRLELNLEIARSEAEREQGLMFRQAMAANEGMVFVFEDVAPRAFWMKDTYIPLDIIFLDGDDKVLSIGRGEPRSLASVFSGGPAGHVIELNQGTALKLGIKAGDQVRFSKNLP